MNDNQLNDQLLTINETANNEPADQPLIVPRMRPSISRTKPLVPKRTNAEVEDARRLRTARLNSVKAKYAGKTDVEDPTVRRIYASLLIDVPLVLELSASRRPCATAAYGGTRIGHHSDRLQPPTAQTLRWTGAFIRYCEKLYDSDAFLARAAELKEHLRGVYTRDGENGEKVAPRALLDNVQMSTDADRLRRANRQNARAVSSLLTEVAWDQLATPVDTAVLLGRVASAMISALCSDQLGLDATTSSYAVMLERALGSGNSAE